MQPQASDPDLPAEKVEPSYARDALARAKQSHDDASAMLRRVAERRVRYQETVIRREIRQAELENERADAIEREEARLDAASETEFMRGQIAPMLEDGWTLEQLEEIGITRELLVSLDRFHEVARRTRIPDDTP